MNIEQIMALADAYADVAPWRDAALARATLESALREALAPQPRKDELDAEFERGRAYGITQVIDKLRDDNVLVRPPEEKP